MNPNNSFKRQRRIAPVAMAIILLLLTGLGTTAHEPGPIGLSNAAPPPGPIVIDFEDLAPDGPETRATVLVTSQYADKGITFNGPLALDYAKGRPIPGFARSGTKAIEQCYEKEFCTTPIEMNFTAAQQRVKVWVGYRGPLGESRTVILRAFDASGVEAGSAVTTLSPSPFPQPIEKAIEVSSTSANIVRAAVSFSPATVPMELLAIDDVEFDTAGPPPVCTSALPASVVLTRPTGAITANLNEFILEGNITTDAPLDEATLSVIGPSGAKSFNLLAAGLVAITGNSLLGPVRIPNQLFPGNNMVTVTVRNCKGASTDSRIVKFAPIAPGSRIKVMGIEITQAIQDLNNTVPLIAGKRTFVRVYLTVEGPTSEILNVSGTLTACHPLFEAEPICGEFLPGLQSLNAITIDSSTDIVAKRRDINASLNFELPPDWIKAGRLHLEISHLDIDGTQLTVPCDGCDNPNPIFPSFPRFDEFKNAPPIEVSLFQVAYELNGTDVFPDDKHVFKLRSWLQRAYPTAEVRAPMTTLTAGFDGLPSCGRVNLHLFLDKAAFFVPKLIFGDGSRKLRYYGLVSDQGGLMTGCATTFSISFFGVDLLTTNVGSGPAGNPAGPQAPINAGAWDGDDSYADWYGGHEIGHLYKRDHPGFVIGGTVGTCIPGKQNDFLTSVDGDYPYPNGRLSGSDMRYFGFDVGDPGFMINPRVYAPDVSSDIMTYCENEWISNYTYEGILETLGGTGARIPVRSAAVTASDALVVAGEIDLADNSVQLDSIWRLQDRELTPRPDTSAFTIDLLDSVNRVLASYPFDPKGSTDIGRTDHRPAFIGEVVSFAPGTTRLVIKKDGNTLASRELSAHSPRVKMLFPHGGESLQGQTTNVRWRGTDADGDRLTYALLYSPDAGASWESVAMALTETSFTLDLATLPGSRRALFRIVATDGFNTSRDDSNATFRVPFKLPEPRIISPGNGSIFSQEQTIVLAGEAYDLEDGALDGTSLQWTSHRQGSLGSGRNLGASGLLPGLHEITLAATDSQGGRSQTSIVIEVKSPIPTIVFGDNSLINCPTDITVTALPGRDSAVVHYPPPVVIKPESTVVLFSPPSGSLFPLGTTTVSVTAIDASGNTSTCTFTVTVNLASPPPLTLTCPGDVRTVVPLGQPSVVVNYPPPALNRPEGATTVCSPPSGSSFPSGMTTVDCTANNLLGETAACTFVVNVIEQPSIDICLQDDSSGNILKFNSPTGVYQFTVCNVVTLSGTGIVTTHGGVITLQDNASDRRVLARVDTSVRRGTATIRLFAPARTFTITDRNIANNTCACP